MLIKFRPGPGAQASAVSSFGSFDGLKRHCTKFEKHKGKLRCAKFKRGRGHPVCDSRLVDGGRSPGLVRPASSGRPGGKCGPKYSKRAKKHSKKRARKR